MSVEKKELPISSHEAHILEMIAKHACVVVVGETGSGKTTQLPQYLYEHGLAKTGLYCS